jgi:hypothetical protein
VKKLSKLLFLKRSKSLNTVVTLLPAMGGDPELPFFTQHAQCTNDYPGGLVDGEGEAEWRVLGPGDLQAHVRVKSPKVRVY